jgi:hypothetical protein
VTQLPTYHDAEIRSIDVHFRGRPLGDGVSGGPLIRLAIETRDECIEVTNLAFARPTRKRRQHKPRAQIPGGLFTLAQAADKLGCSIKTINGHIASGALGYVRIGHGSKRPRRMFTDADLTAFIEAQTRKDSPPCSTVSPARPTGILTSSGAVIAFTDLQKQRPGAKPKK